MVGCGNNNFHGVCVDITTSIGKVMFKHYCYHSANQVAHVLANYSYCTKVSLVWMNEPPDCLVSKLVEMLLFFTIKPAMMPFPKKDQLCYSCS